MILHSAFDLLAVVTAAAVFYFLPLPRSSVGQPWRLHPSYVSFASLGMITGALVAGTGNLLLSGFSEIGKSVVGGLAGAILAIEILKRRLGITGSTGLHFAAPLAPGQACPRIGHRASRGNRLACLDDLIERIEKVTVEELTVLANEFFKTESIAVTVLGNLNGLKLTRDQLAC